MRDNPKIIVIGGNAAGPGAAAKAKRVNPDADVLMIEAGDFISTGTCELPYVLSGDVKDYNDIIFFTPEQFYEKKKVKVLVKHFVEKIDRTNKKILVRNLRDNTLFDQNYDKLIITAGASPKILSAGANETENHFQFTSVTDYLKIKNYLERNLVKRVIIFGAGYIGLETAEALKSLGIEVVIVEKSELPIPSSEIEIRHLVLSLLEKENIEFYGDVNEPKFNFSGNKISSVNISGRIIDCDMVISSIGFKPNNQLAVSSKIETGSFGGIKVDKKLRTSDQNIYAAGDCTEIINHVTGKPDYIPLASIAHDQGHIAGANAAGDNLFFEPVVKNLAVKIFDRTLTTVGITTEEALKQKIGFGAVHALAPSLVKVMPDSRKTFGKIIFESDSKRILGAEFFGNNEVIGYADLISALIKRNESARFLARINFNYTPPKSPFINILSILGRKVN